MEGLLQLATIHEHNEDKRIKHYSSSHRILLVGEGDFSFAACLARAFLSATNMVATSLDSEVELMSKHPSSLAHLKELKERGCTVIHGVNAFTMSQHPGLHQIFFDRIVFNFPHDGFTMSEHSAYQIELHQNVVRAFLRNALKMLAFNGEVHVTHKTAYPFSKWKIEKLADDEGLRLVEKANFSIWDYPGYDNKRGDGPRTNATFPVGGCSTFKFAKI